MHPSDAARWTGPECILEVSYAAPWASTSDVRLPRPLTPLSSSAKASSKRRSMTRRRTEARCPTTRARYPSPRHPRGCPQCADMRRSRRCRPSPGQMVRRTRGPRVVLVSRGRAVRDGRPRISCRLLPTSALVNDVARMDQIDGDELMSSGEMTTELGWRNSGTAATLSRAGRFLRR